jgi:hypothetical protein
MQAILKLFFKRIMRRIDAIGVGLGIFMAGGAIYGILLLLGFDNITAGIWSEAVLTFGLIGWLLTYVFRVGSKNMTIHQQMKDYQDAFIQKRLEEMTEEELAQLQAEIELEEKG